MEMNCLRCGEPIAPKTKVCPKCGSRDRDIKVHDDAEGSEIVRAISSYIVLQSGKKIVLRNIIRRRGNIVEPMIQVEMKDNSRTFQIIRCDRNGGVGLHLDMYNKQGRKEVSHEPLRSQTAEGAIVEVVDRLKEELEGLLRKLGFGDEVKDLPVRWKIELEEAKKHLLLQAKSLVGRSVRTSLGYSMGVTLVDRRNERARKDDGNTREAINARKKGK